MIAGQVSALAVTGDSAVIAQLREPATLLIFGDVNVPLSDESREDTGHTLFHMSSRSGISCANCHREGGDDGMVYDFSEFGPRCTQSLRGGLLQTAPFHWEGERADIAAVVRDTWIARMGGDASNLEQAEALGAWLDHLPANPAPSLLSRAAVKRGREVFALAACGDCHLGPAYTDNQSWDVGNGEGPTQTSTLIGLAARAPYMHDGCAETVRDRFQPECGGTRHGNVEELSELQLADLSEYLLSL